MSLTMQPFVQKVDRTLKHLLRGLPTHSLLLACSMGPDSMAMTLALLLLQEKWDLSLHGVYIHHGLRKAADEEAQLFLSFANAHGLSASVEKVQVPHGASIQAGARKARYNALVRIAKNKNIQCIATGHTSTDQSETILMRMLGGAGLRGLSGIPLSRTLEQDPHLQLIRPLLFCSRQDVLGFLKDQKEQPLFDPSNENLAYLRARIRHHVLPILRQEAPNLDEHLCTLGSQLRWDADYLDSEADYLFHSLCRRDLHVHDQSCSLDTEKLKKLPKAMQVRLIQKLSPIPLSTSHLFGIMDLFSSGGGSKTYTLPDGMIALVSYGILSFVRTNACPQRENRDPIKIKNDGTYRLGLTSITVERLSSTYKISSASQTIFVPMDETNMPLQLRYPRPGDRIQLLGMIGRKKISDLFIDSKIPKDKRSTFPLLCDREQNVLWVIGLKVSSHCMQ